MHIYILSFGAGEIFKSASSCPPLPPSLTHLRMLIFNERGGEYFRRYSRLSLSSLERWLSLSPLLAPKLDWSESPGRPQSEQQNNNNIRAAGGKGFLSLHSPSLSS